MSDAPKVFTKRGVGFFDNQLGTTRDDDIETAHDAAERNYPLSGKQRRRVLETLVAAGDEGCTDYEIGVALDIQRTSAGKRRLELKEMGLVEETDERRATDTGSKAAVWRRTQEAVEALA